MCGDLYAYEYRARIYTLSFAPAKETTTEAAEVVVVVVVVEEITAATFNISW